MASVVAELRAVCPHRPLTFTEGLRVAELQANRLLQAAEVREPAAQMIGNLGRLNAYWILLLTLNSDPDFVSL